MLEVPSNHLTKACFGDGVYELETANTMLGLSHTETLSLPTYWPIIEDDRCEPGTASHDRTTASSRATGSVGPVANNTQEPTTLLTQRYRDRGL